MKKIFLMGILTVLLVSILPYVSPLASCIVPYGISSYDLRSQFGIGEPISFTVRVKSQVGSDSGIQVIAYLKQGNNTIGQSPLGNLVSTNDQGLTPVLSFDGQKTPGQLTITVVATEIKGSQTITNSKDFTIQIANKLKIIPSLSNGLVVTNNQPVTINYNVIDAYTGSAPTAIPTITGTVDLNGPVSNIQVFSDHLTFSTSQIGLGTASIVANLQGYISDQQNITFNVRAPDKTVDLLLDTVNINSKDGNKISAGTKTIEIDSTYDGVSPRPVSTVQGSIKRPDGGIDQLTFTSNLNKDKWSTTYNFLEQAKEYDLKASIITYGDPTPINVAYTIVTLTPPPIVCTGPDCGGASTRNLEIIIGSIAAVVIMAGIIITIILVRRRKR